MSPRWGAKGISIGKLKGKERNSSRRVSEENLPQVIGGVKTMTLREPRSKKSKEREIEFSEEKMKPETIETGE